MKIVLPRILVLTFILFQQVSMAAPAFIHPVTKIEIPNSLGPFQFLEGELSANPELGSILAFKSKETRDSQMTLYISKKDMTLSEQVEDARAAILQHKENGLYSRADLKDTTKISAKSHRFTGYLEVEDINDPTDVTKLQTYALFVSLGDYTLKIRISSLKDFESHADHCKQLEKAVLKLVSEQTGN